MQAGREPAAHDHQVQSQAQGEVLPGGPSTGSRGLSSSWGLALSTACCGLGAVRMGQRLSASRVLRCMGERRLSCGWSTAVPCSPRLSEGGCCLSWVRAGGRLSLPASGLHSRHYIGAGRLQVLGAALGTALALEQAVYSGNLDTSKGRQLQELCTAATTVIELAGARVQVTSQGS